jgi:hypothetical protein
VFEKRDLDAAVREQLRPVLKKAGFTRFEGRNAWRITPDAIDIVLVQLTREETDEQGYMCPSRTFFVHMACRDRRHWPGKTNPKTGTWRPTKLPRDYDCANRYRYGLDARRPHFEWEVSVDGSNLKRLMKELVEHVVIDGLPWFEAKHAELRSPENADEPPLVPTVLSD